MNCVLREVELAALPDGAGQDGAAGGLQPGMVVADDEADAAHAAVDQAVEEGSPVDFGFRGIAGDAEHAPLPVRRDADGGEQGGIANHAAVAQLLVAGVEEEIVDLAQRPAAPGGSSSSNRAAARLTWVDDRLFRPNSAITLAASRVETPCTYISAIASITAREDRRPRCQRLRIERLVNSGGLGYVDGHRPGRGIDCLALVAVGIAAPIGWRW